MIRVLAGGDLGRELDHVPASRNQHFWPADVATLTFAGAAVLLLADSLPLKLAVSHQHPFRFLELPLQLIGCDDADPALVVLFCKFECGNLRQRQEPLRTTSVPWAFFFASSRLRRLPLSRL